MIEEEPEEPEVEVEPEPTFNPNEYWEVAVFGAAGNSICYLSFGRDDPYAEMKADAFAAADEILNQWTFKDVWVSDDRTRRINRSHVGSVKIRPISQRYPTA